MIDKKSIHLIKRRLVVRSHWQASVSSMASVPLTIRSIALIVWTLTITVFSYAMAVIVLN